MKPTTINIDTLDQWLFDHFEGNLQPGEEEALQDFLSAHPELTPELEAWGNTYVQEPEMAWPGEAQFLKERAWIQSVWNTWTIGLNALLIGVGVSLAFYLGSGESQTPGEASLISENSFQKADSKEEASISTLPAHQLRAGTDPDPAGNSLIVAQGKDQLLMLALPSKRTDDDVWENTDWKDAKKDQKSDSDNLIQFKQAKPAHTNLVPAEPSKTKDANGAVNSDQNGPGSRDNFSTQLKTAAPEVPAQNLKAETKPVSESPTPVAADPASPKAATSAQPLPLPVIKEDPESKDSRRTKPGKEKRGKGKANWVPIHSDPF